MSFGTSSFGVSSYGGIPEEDFTCSAAFEGKGDFTADILIQKPMSATLSGSGSLDVAPTTLLAMSCDIRGYGSLTAYIKPDKPKPPPQARPEVSPSETLYRYTIVRRS